MSRRGLALCATALMLCVSLAEARPVDCQLDVGGKTVMRGRCEYDAGSDGSFRIEGKTHIAHVNVEKPGVAWGDWSAKPDNRSSYQEVSDLRRSGACWSNATVKVCAWGAGQRPKSK